MAILSKIRQRSILLILIIALALFSFVLADVIKSGGFGGGSNNIGSVNGTKFEYQEFMNKVANVEKQQQGILFKKFFPVFIKLESQKVIGIIISEYHYLFFVLRVKRT